MVQAKCSLMELVRDPVTELLNGPKVMIKHSLMR